VADAYQQAISVALAAAKGMLGKNEVPDHGEIMQYLHGGGQELDPHKSAWCAAFVSASLQKAGLPVPTQVVKDSAFGPGAYAPNYKTYGSAVDPENVQAGDILVANDGSHVGFSEGPIRQGRNGPEAQLLAGNERDTSGQYALGSFTSPAGVLAKRSQVGMVGERWVPLSQYSARRLESTADSGAASTAPPTSPNNSIIDTLSKNIAGIESGGWKNPYEAQGPVVPGRGRAIGKYQVMPENVGGWTLAATGKSLTPEQFQNDPAAQEAVFRDQMQRSLQLYGPRDAASIWFTGKPFKVAGGGASDRYTSNADYVARATAGLDGSETFKPGAAVAAAGSSSTSPPAAAPAKQSIWDKLTDVQLDKEGKPIAGAKSPVQQLGEMASNRLAAEGQRPQDEAPAQSALGQGPGARNVSPGLMNVAQTYGQTLNSFSQPLTWGHAPLQGTGMAMGGLRPAAAAPVPGMTLNSFQPSSQGLGYGVNDLGYGFS
jgi:hypothetical protein